MLTHHPLELLNRRVDLTTDDELTAVENNPSIIGAFRLTGMQGRILGTSGPGNALECLPD